MPVEVTFELPYTEWGWKVGFYVAMIGIASGAYLMGYIADILSQKRNEPSHGQVAQYGYLAGILGMAIGPPVLLSHLATPFRALMLPMTMTNLGSWMALGTYLIAGFVLGAFLMFGWTAFGTERPHRRAVAADGGTDHGTARAATGDSTANGIRGVASRVGLLDLLDTLADKTRPSETVRLGIGAVFGVLAAGVLVYSAMAYGSGPTERVALWDPTFLLPVKILGGLAAGLTVAVGFAAIANRPVGRTIQNYSLAASGLLVATLVAVLAAITLLPEQLPAAEPAVENLLSTHATLFVGGAVVGGLVVPILLSVGAVVGQRRGALSPAAATGAYVAAAALVVVGKVALALAYLMAAEFAPLPLPM
ncbi:dehydrogenase [Natronolimnohabitans sp. A-GB9]|uniref:dehydrogenase n=1 Tax=Natronolimnohabitans sp. A-GB9 TaxID=3069757 RepID=UPI0027AF5B1C|nr:dehydrogenase [Natronolimnohabitans sp. A-GB9]MDQ2050639.1 dehydrogenase [Natronolimnohabitans sp. A-GB9]